MISKKEIETIIRRQIEKIEKLGDQGSASGHLSNVSYELNDFSLEEMEDGLIRVGYSYTTYVETEFTYDPDNPPYEYPHERVMIINQNREVLSDVTKN